MDESTSVEVFTPHQIISGRADIIVKKQTELTAAREAVTSLRGAGAGHSRVDRARERVKFLERTISALEAGYVPIPRFDGQTLNLDVEELPAQSLVALSYAQNSEVFDEIRIVRGRQPDTNGPGGRRRGARDPLLVGVVRSPNHRVEAADGHFVQWIPGRETHFLIAWWQPEDERDDTLF